MSILIHLLPSLVVAVLCLTATCIALPTTTTTSDGNQQNTSWADNFTMLEAAQLQYPILLDSGDSIPEIKVNIDGKGNQDHARHPRQVSPFAPTPAFTDYLLFANRRFIVRINPDGTGLQAISLTSSLGTPNAVGIDYDIRNDLLFWSDVQFQKIYVSYLNGTNVRELVSSGVTSPDGIAWDWINHKLYWTDAVDKDIEVIDLLSGNRKVLFNTGPLSMPRAIVVDPINRFIYWSDWGQPAVIERASMDGTNRQTLHTGLGWPNGLAIDLNSQTLYWADALIDRIESSNTDGSNRALLTTTHVYEPFGLDIHQGTIYRTDWLIKAMLKSPVSNPGNLGLVISNLLERGMALRVVSFQKQPFVPNFCLINSCSHLCLLSNTDPRGYSCVCPEGMHVSSDQATCIPGAGPITPPTSSSSDVPPSSSSPPTIPTSQPTTQAPPTCTPACQNRGTCNAGGVCSCTADWTGVACQEPVCSPSCQNGGTCSSPGHCDCPPGYTGLSCERPVCSPSCQNGGTCSSPGHCDCPPGYTGDICERPVCSQSCLNGGRCTAPGICTCLDPFTGPRCEREPLLRYFNPFQQTFDHFYTNNLNERNNAYHLESTQCRVLSDPIPGQTVPLLRYWSPAATDHLYTTNAAEIGSTTKGVVTSSGYIFECDVGHCFPAHNRPSGTVPLHRYWNPAGTDHFYTTHCNELGFTDASVGLVNGHQYEGVVCYVYPAFDGENIQQCN